MTVVTNFCGYKNASNFGINGLKVKLSALTKFGDDWSSSC